VIVVVLGAGLLHATWNAIAKYISDGLVAFALIGAASTVGGAATLFVTGLPYGAAIPFAATSAAVHIAYELALMNSYRLGAFNQTYPIARGTSPLVVAAGAYVFAHESLGAVPLAGVAVLAVGLMSLAVSAGRLSQHDLPAVGAAVLTGLAIATYTLIDGLGVRHAHDPYAYGGLLFLIQGPVIPVVALMRRPLSSFAVPAVVARGLSAGVLSVVAYVGVLWAQTRAPLAEVAALRETSVISAAVIGTLLLKERFGLRRAAAAALVAAGILLIAV
jgi:drug/metabolite transporter (DMT)-like permease